MIKCSIRASKKHRHITGTFTRVGLIVLEYKSQRNQKKIVATTVKDGVKHLSRNKIRRQRTVRSQHSGKRLAPGAAGAHT